MKEMVGRFEALVGEIKKKQSLSRKGDLFLQIAALAINLGLYKISTWALASASDLFHRTLDRDRMKRYCVLFAKTWLGYEALVC